MVNIRFHSASGHDHSIDVTVADNPLTRMRGLLARPPLQSGQGMLIHPCNMVHTVGMRYPIDVVFVGRDGIVLKVAPSVPPLRMRMHLKARSVLELVAGEAARCGIVPGSILPLER